MNDGEGIYSQVVKPVLRWGAPVLRLGFSPCLSILILKPCQQIRALSSPMDKPVRRVKEGQGEHEDCPTADCLVMG